MAVDPAEPQRVADAVAAMQLRYVVLTAVARDDLADHGATLFTSTMAAIRARNPLIAIEVLTPDFWGGVSDPDQAMAAQRKRLATVLAADPVCFNHNLETVQRLQGEVAWRHLRPFPGAAGGLPGPGSCGSHQIRADAGAR